jgi:hypothetical protein
MKIRTVDPRDTEWQVDRPRYRVVMWERAEEPSVSAPDPGFRAAEFELSEVRDIEEVLSWAGERSRPGVTVAVYALLDLDGKRGLVRLSGSDPTTR